MWHQKAFTCCFIFFLSPQSSAKASKSKFFFLWTSLLLKPILCYFKCKITSFVCNIKTQSFLESPRNRLDESLLQVNNIFLYLVYVMRDWTHGSAEGENTLKRFHEEIFHKTLSSEEKVFFSSFFFVSLTLSSIVVRARK